MDWLAKMTVEGLSILSMLFVFAAGIAVLVVAVLFVIDITQTKNAIRRNYPVVGRFRALFSTLGEFFRQYFFAMDREEMPFNRAERDWVYKSSEGVDNTVAFGSTKRLSAPGTVIFANAPYAVLDEETAPPPAVVFGRDCQHPYETRSLINVSAMSFGAISAPAVRALSKGAKRACCWLNTGEGGLSPHHLEAGCDIVFQIGTAKYGVRTRDGGLDEDKLAQIAARKEVRMIEIKLSQGAKPGKGGLLPGVKVSDEIARVRGIAPGRDSVSPNRFREVGSNRELLDFIARLRAIAGIPVGIKTVIGDNEWLAALCREIKERGAASAPDFITVDSGDGGSGAAPMPLIDNVGLPIRQALPHVDDVLTRHGLRQRIGLIASGKLITPAEVAWAYCAGADAVNSARGFMFALGCIQSLRCNRNTCPTGIATHDARLQRGLDPEIKAERVAKFVEKIHYGVGLIAHSCGVPHARALARHHCLIVQPDGRPVRFDELHPPQRRRSRAA